MSRSLGQGDVARARVSPAYYPRTRLFRWLDAARGSARLIWLHGPAGSGKTALIESYLTGRQIHSPWFSFAGAESPQAFFSRLSTVARGAQPSGRSYLPLCADSSDPSQNFAHDYFRTLCARFPAPVFVFDDCHVAHESHMLDVLFESGVDVLPPGCNLIFISRQAPPPRLMRQLANRSLALLDWDELKLTPEESSGVARILGRRERTSQCALTLHEQSGGWVAGLVLLLHKTEAASRGRRRNNEEGIHAYFNAEVFEHANAETRAFMIETAVLPVMGVGHAMRITRNPHAARILADLHARHCFTEMRRDDGETRYQYHPLFRAFLRARATCELAPSALRRVERRAALLMEGEGQIDYAAQSYCERRDHIGLMRLVRRHAESLISAGRMRPLREWLAAVPKSFQARSASWHYWMGRVATLRDAGESAQNYAKAHTLFMRQGHLVEAAQAAAGVVFALMAAGDRRAMDPWLEEVLTDSGTDADSAVDVHGFRLVAARLMVLYARRPGHADLPRQALRLRGLFGVETDPRLRLLVARHWLEYILWYGSAAQAALLTDSLRALIGEDSPVEARWYWALIESRYELVHGDAQRALAAALRAHALADAHPELGDAAEVVWHEGFARLRLGQTGELRAVLRRAAPGSGTAALALGRYHHLAAAVALVSGDAAQAEEHAHAAVAAFAGCGYPLCETLLRLMLAYSLHEQGNVPHAREILNELGAYIHAGHSAQLGALVSLLNWHCGDAHDDDGGAMLSTTFGIARRLGYSSLLWWQSRLMAQACARALELGIETAYVQTLVRRHALPPEAMTIPVEHWPWPVRVYTLGRFALVLDGEPLRQGRKAQHKPLEMLKTLIAFGAREVGEDSLTAVLWPEAEGDAAHVAFDTTLHRLRKLLGSEKALVLTDHRLTLDNRYCWVDVWSLERLLGQCEQQLRGASEGYVEHIAQMSDRIFALYQGQFLGKEPGAAWSISLRERLRSKYLRHVSEVATYWQRVGHMHRAIECYQRGLEVDDLAEEFYRNLMLCYQKLGLRSEALAVYRRCRSTLSIVLGIAPSPATEAAHNALIAH
jgi:DNA-binding SARP family transcriptional activator